MRLKHKGDYPTEQQECIWFIEWTKLHKGFFDHIDHNAKERKCSMAQGVLLKKMGSKKGSPDYHYARMRGGYGGLYIEVKRAKPAPSKISPEQHATLERLSLEGYCCWVCYGWIECSEVLKKYESSLIIRSNRAGMEGKYYVGLSLL